MMKVLMLSKYIPVPYMCNTISKLILYPLMYSPDERKTIIEKKNLLNLTFKTFSPLSFQSV